MTREPTLLQILSSVEVLSSLSPSEMNQLLQAFSLRTLRVGDVVIAEGDLGGTRHHPWPPTIPGPPAMCIDALWQGQFQGHQEEFWR